MDAAAALRPPLYPTLKPLFSPPPPSHTTISLPKLKSTSLVPRIAAPSIPLTTAGPALVFEFEQLGLTHTETESLRRRIHSLHSLGLTASALRRTFTRRPEVLSSPEIEPFIYFVTQHLPGLRPAKLERLLLSVPPRHFSSKISLLLDHGFPHQELSHLVNNVDARKVFGERPLKDLEETVLFLEPYGWPELILRRPVLLNLDLHSQLMPRVEFLTDLGGGDEVAVAFLIRKLPAILAYTVEHFQSHLEFWRSVGLTDEQVFKIALVYPNVFSVSRERKLVPRIEFLDRCGLGAEDIFRFLIKAPLFLSLSYEENLSKKLAFLLKIGYQHSTRELAMAVGAITRTSCENLQAVIGVFLRYGLACEDVLAMSKKHPQVLQYTYGSLEKKMEFLIEGMGRDVGELLVFPAFLGYKLDDRIKQRYEAKMKTRGKKMSLNKLLSVSSKKFVLLVEDQVDRNAVQL